MKDPDITCVFSDVHSNLSALDAVLRDARGHGAKAYIFLGDAVGYGPEPARCIARLAELPRAICIRGNHDHAIASAYFEPGMNPLARECAVWTRSVLGEEDLAWLGTLPVDHEESDWLAVHGAPRDPRRLFAYVTDLTFDDDLRSLRERNLSLCFYGHTHVQETHSGFVAGAARFRGERPVTLSSDRTWLVNPGSVGQPRDGDPRAAYALWNRRTGELTPMRIAYDIEATTRALRHVHLPPRLEERLRIGH